MKRENVTQKVLRSAFWSCQLGKQAASPLLLTVSGQTLAEISETLEDSLRS
jgi:hypothetical protein